VSSAKIEAIKVPALSADFTAEEALLLELTDAMTRDIVVSDALMDRLKQRYDEKTVVETVATVAAYNIVSRFLVALQIQH
jgi:4-carboxymuconolactone decarboxylase